MDKHSAILITGAGGFVGKNLCAALRCRGYDNLLMFDLDTPKEPCANMRSRPLSCFIWRA